MKQISHFWKTLRDFIGHIFLCVTGFLAGCAARLCPKPLKVFWKTLTEVTKKFNNDHLPAFAAQSTFYLMLSFFPFVMLFCMASRLLPMEEDTLLTVARLVLPENYREIGVNLIDGYYNENITSARIVLIAFLIWMASRLIQALINGFNTAYGIVETRPQTTIRFISCIYIVALCALMLGVLLMCALGSRLIHYLTSALPVGLWMDLLFSLVRNLASPLLLLAMFWLSYVILPSHQVRQRERHMWRDELPGAFLTVVVWRGAAELFFMVIANSMQRYSYVYGSLSSVILVLVWLYTGVYFWFVGAELNAYLQRRKDGKTDGNV